MTSEILKRCAIFTIALVAYSLFGYIRSDEGNFLKYLETAAFGLLILGVFGSGWVAAGSFTSQAWDGLKSAFPDRFQQKNLPKHFAVGDLRTSDTEISPIGPVMTSALDDGLIIAKLRKKPKPKHFICIPWRRVQRVRVHEPVGLAKCKSARDCGLLAGKLRAELTISRGDFPPIKIKVPWHDMFGGKLPPNIDLEKGWEWPYALHTVI